MSSMHFWFPIKYVCGQNLTKALFYFWPLKRCSSEGVENYFLFFKILITLLYRWKQLITTLSCLMNRHTILTFWHLHAKKLKQVFMLFWKFQWITLIVKYIFFISYSFIASWYMCNINFTPIRSYLLVLIFLLLFLPLSYLSSLQYNVWAT